MCPSTPTPLNRQTSCLMPPITRANCQSENFTITNHNTHYTKRQLISHQHQHQHTLTPTPMDKINPNSKSQRRSKILIKLKFQPITVQKNQIKLVFKNRERERERLSFILFQWFQIKRERVRVWERVREKKREKLVKWNILREHRSREAWRLRLRQWRLTSEQRRWASDVIDLRCGDVL